MKTKKCFFQKNVFFLPLLDFFPDVGHFWFLENFKNVILLDRKTHEFRRKEFGDKLSRAGTSLFGEIRKKNDVFC